MTMGPLEPHGGPHGPTDAGLSPKRASASPAGPPPLLRPAAASTTGRRRSYRLARRRDRRRPANLSLNLTAMIDTVFMLLFFFMVASRFGAIEGLLSAPLPSRASAAPVAPAAEVPRTPLRIRLEPDPAGPEKCRAVIEQFSDSPLAMSALPGELARIRRTVEGFDDAKVPVYLIAGDDVAWDHVVNAYNAALVARYERIFFAGGT